VGEDRDIRRLYGVPADEEADLLTGGMIDEVLRQESVWVAVPDDLEERVLRELVGVRPAENVMPLRRKPRGLGRVLSPRRIVAIAASAALVALAAGVGGTLLGGDEGDGLTTELAATALARGSHADAVVRDTASGIEIKLDFSGLPPAPTGSYYEGWVVGPRGQVAIGTFHLRHGTNGVILWAGVELDNYPKISVTLQKEGEGPASSGKVLLRGNVPDELLQPDL
jgi:hypothetical protein